MIVITLNVNSGYNIAALNAKEICLFRKLIIMHIGQEAYIYVYIYTWCMNDRDTWVFIPIFLVFYKFY